MKPNNCDQEVVKKMKDKTNLGEIQCVIKKCMGIDPF